MCQTLRSALLTYHAIILILSKNGSWWSSFSHETHATSQTPIEALVAFAARSCISNNPTELGALVVAYDRSSNQNDHLYDIVDGLLIPDFGYSATTEGMECVILVAKSYPDSGQLRQAWFMYRRGMAIVQLMVHVISYYCSSFELVTGTG